MGMIKNKRLPLTDENFLKHVSRRLINFSRESSFCVSEKKEEEFSYKNFYFVIKDILQQFKKRKKIKSSASDLKNDVHIMIEDLNQRKKLYLVHEELRLLND